jgi:hypothetical protein
LAAGNVATLKIYLPLALNSVAAGSSVVQAQTAVSASGSASFTYDVSSNRLDYQIQIDVTAPLQITGIYIRRGAAGEVGSAAHSLLAASTLVTPSLTLDDSLILAGADEAALVAGELYLDVRSTEHPLGELRDQLNMFPVGDGAANQLYIDEIATLPYAPADFTEGYTALFKYPGARNIQEAPETSRMASWRWLTATSRPWNGRASLTLAAPSTPRLAWRVSMTVSARPVALACSTPSWTGRWTSRR